MGNNLPAWEGKAAGVASDDWHDLCNQACAVENSQGHTRANARTGLLGVAQAEAHLFVGA
jgi:hypothetical protein